MDSDLRGLTPSGEVRGIRTPSRGAPDRAARCAPPGRRLQKAPSDAVPDSRRFDGHEIMTCATVSGSAEGQPTVILISVDREFT
jgi:hypothetical protein